MQTLPLCAAAAIPLLMICSTALADDAPAGQSGLVQNPGFEQGEASWEQPSPQPDTVSVERQQAHTGNASLKMLSHTGQEFPGVAQTVADLEAGARYRLSVWVKGDGATVPSLAAARLEFQDGDGNTILKRGIRRQPALTGEWWRLDLFADAPRQATRAAITLQMFGRGAVWFDDVTLSPISPAPPLWLTPTRQAVAAGRNKPATLIAHFAKRPETAGVPQLIFTVTRPGARTPYKAAARVEQLTDLNYRATLTLPSTTAGAYEIRCSLPGLEGQALATVFVPRENRRPTGLSDSGNILMAGKPFFPIGLHHVGINDYAEVGKQGFNCVQGPASMEMDLLGDAFNKAVDARISLNVPLYAGGFVAANMEGSQRKVKRYGRHVALACWTLLDHPEARDEVADQVPGAYHALRTADPVRPIALTISDVDEATFWAQFCDTLQVTAHPLPGKPLSIVGERMRKARAALEPWQNLTAVLQAGWLPDGANQPTLDKARVMLYLALVNGARGVMWYAYRDPGWNLERSALWTRFREINQETEHLSTPIMVGEEMPELKVESSNKDLQWLARAHAGSTYVLLVNPGDAPAEISINPGTEIAAAPCLRGKPATVESGAVKLTIPGPGAETVMLRLTGTGSVKKTQ